MVGYSQGSPYDLLEKGLEVWCNQHEQKHTIRLLISQPVGDFSVAATAGCHDQSGFAARGGKQKGKVGRREFRLDGALDAHLEACALLWVHAPSEAHRSTG